MPQGYRARGQDAQRLGDFANQFGQRLINVRARIAQARRAKDVSDYIGQVESDYSNAIATDPSPENILKQAHISRGRIGQVGSDPLADKSINRFDEEVRQGRSSIAARRQNIQTMDVDYMENGLPKTVSRGGITYRQRQRRDVASGSVIPNSDFFVKDDDQTGTFAQQEAARLRRENGGKGNENDLTNLHMKREQLGKTINEWQNNYQKAEEDAATKGLSNVTYPKDYVVAQKQKLQNQLDLVKKQILAKGGTVDEGVQPIQSAVTTRDQEAINWAKQNPNDPRAVKILKLHGLK